MMMRDDSHEILSDLLSRWHSWCRGWRPSAQSADPMFRHALRAKGEQTLQAIIDDSVEAAQMKAVDFQVSEMEDPYRAAIYCEARNCYTGRQVWLSPRLPECPIERAAIVAKARSILTERLLRAGVM